MNVLITDSFRGDAQHILEKIKKGENFSLARTGDGELSIISNKFIDLTSKKNGEFKFDPNDETDEFYRAELIKSHRYSHDEYYMGISCPCCEAKHKVEWMRSTVGTKKLTWANLFVNGNYNFFLEKYIPELQKRQTVMVCNRKSNIDLLPFKVKKTFFVGTNSYKEDYEVLGEIKKYIADEDARDHVFILCAGPLSNILAYRLFDFNKNNTYIDCGSVFDPLMGLGKTRGYHNESFNTRNKNCIW